MSAIYNGRSAPLRRAVAPLALAALVSCQSATDPSVDNARQTSIQVDGVLTWEDGVPISGIRVEVLDLDRVVATALSDAAGWYGVRWTQRCTPGGLTWGVQIGGPPGVPSYSGASCTGEVTCTSAPQRRDCIYRR